MQTRIRGGFKKREPYPLNQPPPELITAISQRIVYLLARGHGDVGGGDWSKIFAKSIDGVDRSSPLGLADVSWNGCCWSLKTVKNPNPFTAQRIRLIAGRNSPVFSSGINDPFHDIQTTGDSVLTIYNSRLSEAHTEHSEVRLGILIRNMTTLEFTFFERSIAPIPLNDFRWELNRHQNFEAFLDARHAFTWQPHGSQFTIIEEVPQSATRFRILQRPNVASLEAVLRDVGFTQDWIEIVG